MSTDSPASGGALSTSSESLVSPSMMRRIATVAFVGASVDSYDFFIYATAAALVFSKAFFPEVSTGVGILLSFASFGVGFAARPLGGIIFGHIGDRYGRKTALVVCLLGTGICTTLMGLLPTYATIGVWAGVLLVVLRIIQGVLFGGEAGSALMLMGEVAPGKHRGLFGGLALAGAPGGIILANGVFFIVTASTSLATFEAWAWRIPFLLSVLLVALSLYAHWMLEESPLFLKEGAGDKGAGAQKSTATASGASGGPHVSPVWLAIVKNWREILLGAGSYASLNVGYYVIAAFAVHYVTKKEVGLSSSAAVSTLFIAALIGLAASISAGHLSDRIERGKLMVILSGAFVVWSFAMWPLINTGSYWAVLVAIIVGFGILANGQIGIYGAMVMELFPTETRFSGFSLAIQLCSVFAGGFAPLIAAALFQRYNSTVPVAALVAGWSVITCICSGIIWARTASARRQLSRSFAG